MPALTHCVSCVSLDHGKSLGELEVRDVTGTSLVVMRAIVGTETTAKDMSCSTILWYARDASHGHLFR
jgi:hypothetical protein